MAQKKDDKWVVVVDGKEGKAYDGVSIPTYSPDSKHLAYAAQSQGKWMVVVDGKEAAGRFSAIVKGATLVFTDNTHFHTMVLDPAGQAFVHLRDRDQKLTEVRRCGLNTPNGVFTSRCFYDKLVTVSKELFFSRR